MPSTDEIARLILESTTKGFPDAKAQIADLETKLQALKAQYSSGAIDIDAYFDNGQKLQGGLDQLRGAVKAAEDALRKHGDAQKASAALAQQAQTRMGGFTQAIQASGYALQDFASAGGGLANRLNSISNNIPQIVAGLGIGGPWGVGFAAATSSVAALSGVLIKLIPEAIDPAADRLKYLTERIEELEKRPHKVAIDLQELEAARGEARDLKAELEAIERLRTSQSEAEQKSGKAVGEVLAEAPGGGQAVRDALRRQLLQEREAQLAGPLEEARQKAQAAIAEYAGTQFETLAREDAAKIMQAAEKARNEALTAYRVEGGGADKDAGRILTGAQAGAGATQAAKQAELRRRLEQAGMGRTAAELGFATPEAVQADEAAQRDYANQKRQAALRKQLDKKEEERQKADVEALEQQLHNQDVIEKDLAKTTADARKQQEAAEKRRLATLARRVGGGTLGEEAQAYAARLQERQPGISDADLRAQVQAAVTQEVARRAPQLAPAERAGVISTVTEQALAAPPEDVAARQARQAAALPRQQRAAFQQGYTEEAQMRGFNPQAAAEIGRRATAGFERTGKLQESLFAAIDEFQALIAAQQQHIAALENGIGRVRAGNAALQARQRTAARNGGMN